MQLSQFHFDLPNELIARYPLKERSQSRLLCLNRHTGKIIHRQFTDLLDWLKPHDILVCNNSRVIPARLFGFKESGGQVEILVERILDAKRILVHLRASKKPKPGQFLLFARGIRLQMLKRVDELFELSLVEESRSILSVIESIGTIPLPHYMDRLPDEDDIERYQTIYAKEKGSVAAPTAGLHFDEALFAKIREKNVEIGYITLHVGAGTFKPVRVANIKDHRMHAEYIEVSAELCEKIKIAKAKGGRVIAVGTTSARSLETASQTGVLQPFYGETRLFLYPGAEFRCIDVLITNFHLPCSSLLMLVSAFGGHAAVMSAYQQAVAQKYRFYSYGDAMLVD